MLKALQMIDYTSNDGKDNGVRAALRCTLDIRALPLDDGLELALDARDHIEN